MPAQAQAPVLNTKLHPPEFRDRVGRRALLARLTAATRAKLVLIRAPAGWGKSTLMSQWRRAESSRRGFAWLTLDPHDSDPVRFWTYVVGALRVVTPGVGERTLALLRAPGVDLTTEMLPVLVQELSDLPAPVILALDDYHRIDADAVDETLRGLLEFLPPTVTVAIAARTEPAFPLARLRVRGELVEIDGPSLRFSLPESTDFLNTLLGLELDDADVQQLYERTEGWPAGLYLAALSLGVREDRSAFVAGFASDDRHVVDYLLEEVLAAQDPDTRQFLLQTSILDRLCGPLCDAVTTRGGSARTLDELARSNLFVVELDERRSWYRYHHLLQSCLKAEIARAEAGEIAELHRRAAAWHLGAGEISDAVHHTIAAGDYETARELIARHWAPMMLVTAGQRTVEDWFAALPERLIAGDLRLCVARSYICQSLGRLPDVARWTLAAETAPLPGPFYDGFSSARGALACVRAGYHWLSGDVGQAMTAAQEVLDAEAPTSAWRGIGYAVLGLTYAAHGDWSQGRESVEQWVEVGRGAGQAVPQISGLSSSAAWSVELDDWDRAAEHAEHALRLSARSGFEEHWICAGAHFARGRLLERDDDRNGAKRELRRALELAKRGAGPVTTTWLLTHLVRLLVTCDDPAGAQACLDEARAALASAPDPAAVSGMFEAAGRLLAPSRSVVSGEDPLSERELSVLRLLATDLTQREIGGQLYVSLNTVKSHTKSIFRKLGVSAREQAVARARELRLI